jgi:lysophospholipase L1-like esterase
LIYTTDAETATLDAYTNIYATIPTMADIGVRVNNSDLGAQNFTANGTQSFSINLGSGASKKVEFIAGLQSGTTSATRIGSYVGGVSFNKPATLNTIVTSPRLVVYGDSITVGANCTDPSLQGAWQIVRNSYNGSLLEEARGFRSLYEDAGDATARTAFTAFLAGLNPSIIWLAIGTNDYAGTSWNASNFGAAYADLLDKLHVALPSCVIYAQTPIVRTGETANTFGDTTGAYRTAIANAQSSRSSYCTLVDGTAILVVGDLDDGVHPTTAGHAKYAAAVKTILGL